MSEYVKFTYCMSDDGALYEKTLPSVPGQHYWLYNSYVSRVYY